MNFSVKKANLKNIIFKIRHTLFVLERRWRCHPLLGRFYPKKAIYRRALAVFLAFIVLVPSVFLIFRPQKASADWFDDSYANRQNFSFTHNADISTERAITFSLDTATLISAGVMQADCDDTRFTDNNGKVLRYQLTGTCNNAATTYEVVFPSIINGSNVGIVYYGNPQATSHSENVTSVTALTPSGGDPSITTRTNEEKAPAPALSLKFDEGYGQTAYDTSSNRNNGTLGSTASPDTNDPAWQTEDMCISGKCLKFDGTDDYVTTGYTNYLPSNQFTLSAWVKLNSDSTYAGIISANNSVQGGARPYALRVNANRQLYGYVFNSSNVADGLLSNSALSLNTWTYVAYTYDGSNLRIFINGTQDNIKSYSQTLYSSSNTKIDIGTLWGYYLNGAIDDVKVYNYALSASQIKTNVASKIPSVHGISTSFGDDQSYLSNGLVGYWKMDDGVNNPCASGVDKACDSSGNGNVGTWTNGVASTSGKFGNSENFDGVNDYTDVGNGTSLSLTGNFTIAAWINTRDVSSDVHVIYDAGGGNILYTQWNYVYFQKNSTWETITSSATINTNTWYHIVVTKSGTGAGDTKLYINGVQGDTATAIPNLSITTNSLIGAEAGPTRYFNGTLDDVRIYNRALSPSEITRLYDWAPGPVGWWKMDENTGGVANDSSSNGNTGLNKGTYFMPLTVTNSGSTLTDYQASASVNTSTPIAAGHMQSDCDDVRFYDSDGVTSLSYWIESGCNTTTTKFWVKIPSIPGGSKTIYMYYGDSSATAGSNGDNTFMFFDDFNSALDWTNKWQSTATNKETKFYTSGGFLTAQDVPSSGNKLTTKNTFNDFVFESRVKEIDSGSTGYFYQAVTSSATVWTGSEQTSINGNAVALTAVINSVTASGGSGVDNTWYRSKIVFPNTGSASSYLYSDDLGTLHVSQTGTPAYRTGYLNFLQWYSFGTGYADWVFVRKYASTEPTVTAGSETAVNLPWTLGKFGSALKFNGVDDYVSVATTSSSLNFERNNAFSISGWIKTTSSSLSIFSKMANSAPYAGYELRIDASGTLSLFINNTWSSNTLWVSGAQPVNNGTWRYVAATYDGSSTPAGIKFYIDGAEDGKTTNYNSLTASILNSTSINIGVRQTAYYFNGTLDDLRVYDYVRTPKQIISDMNGGHPSVGSPVGSAVVQWNFDEGYGTTAHSSGSCATCSGTLTNMDSPATYGSGWTNNGKFGKALNFDGTNDYIDAGNTPQFNFSNALTLSAWVKKQELSRIESIVSKGPYSLKIGADAKPYMELIAGNETIVDTGQLGSNTYVYTLAVYDGKLYGGTENSGIVYRYDGGTTWTSVGRLGSETRVFSLAVYNDKLYGGTGSGYVYRYDGGTTWTSVGQAGSSTQTLSLAVYDGKLYAGAWASGSAYVYSYDGSTWTSAGKVGGVNTSSVNALAVYDGKLYAGVSDSSNNAVVYRYDGGTTWTSVGSGGSTQNIYALAVYDGKLYNAGTTYNKIYRYDGGSSWTDVGGTSSYVFSLAVYNGKLYAGTGSTTGNIYRYNGGSSWTDLGQLGSETRVNTLAVYDGKLYAGTYATGKVYSVGSGLSVYSGTAIGNEFSHISAAYNGSIAKIFINGVEKGTRTAAVTIGTSSDNLLIGASKGSSQGGYSSSGEEYFSGTLDSVSIYNYALNSQEIKVNYNRGKGIVMGALSTNPDGTATNSAARAYCPPGNSEGNCAAGSDPAPVAHWTLDENTGTSANDISGNANTGTLTNGPAWIPGKIGQALSLDGVDDYVSAGNGSNLNMTSAVTVEAWIKVQDDGVNKCQWIAGKKDQVCGFGTGGYGLYYGWNNDLYFSIGTQTAGQYVNYTVNNAYNNWHHVAGLYDGTNLKLYIDGVLANSVTATVSLTTVTDAFKIGHDNAGNLFLGAIDDVRVYNYARTPAQVAWDYNRGRPIGWWKFDEGQGTTAHDASGNGNNGTLSGTPGWAYKMPFTVTNTGSALTDYQASVSASTYPLIAAGKMQSDCDDVRFYDSDGTTALNYWLESNCNNPTTGTVFWVKIPSIPSGNKTIYMHYGNPGASAGSNGANTFIFFDDFTGSNGSSPDASKWDTTRTGAATLDIQNNMLKSYIPTSTSSYVSSKTTFTLPAIVEFTAQWPDWGNDDGMASFNHGIWYGISGTLRIGDYTCCSGDASGWTGWTGYLVDTPYKFRWTVTSTVYKTEESVKGNSDSHTIATSNSKINLGDNSPHTTHTIYFDDARVRQYTATVPTVTAGSEQGAGKFNSALNFDGVNDYVDTVSTTAFNFERTQPFSVGAWIKTNYSGSSYIVIASNMHATNLAGWEFFVDATRPGDKHLGLALLNSGPTEYLYAKDSTAFNLLDNQWHYVLVTYDGSSSINGIKLYIDGIYKTTTKDNGADSLTTSILSNTSLKIGKRMDSTPYPFLGSIDDVRVYNYVLTPSQIKLLYNGDNAVRFGPATGSP